MPTKILSLNPDNPNPNYIQTVAGSIRQGGLVAFPTETVYGLGANALDERAIERIFQAKERPTSDPIIAHIAQPAQLETVATDIPDLAWTLVERFWPGPLTLVLQRHPRIPANLSAGLDSVAVRMPSHPIALALLEVSGLPIGAPSANLFARPSPTTAQHVLEDLADRIDIVLDGGPTQIGLESTVLDLRPESPIVLRPGGLKIEDLHPLLPKLQVQRQRVFLEPDDGPTNSPGLFMKHYSPRANLRLFSGPLDNVLNQMQAEAKQYIKEEKQVGIMITDEAQALFEALSVQLVCLGPKEDLAQIASQLFAAMRFLDAQAVDIILCHDLGRQGLGEAIWDRLLRAAEGNVIQVRNGL